MEMKWHPIVNGDLSGIQQQETLLFTLFDERQNENYVTTGWVFENEGELEVRGVDPWGLNSNATKKLKAWMELPEPYKPAPDKCFKCNHGHLQHDEDSEPDKRFSGTFLTEFVNALEFGFACLGVLTLVLSVMGRLAYVG